LLFTSYFIYIYFFFFFSSRRRHTRWPRDWSSDVCSSDLWDESTGANRPQHSQRRALHFLQDWFAERAPGHDGTITFLRTHDVQRSEERRVGKECRYRWWAED